ncbi:hypothetical protein GWO43_08830 [candidate division KSB1 bacterium]|nr:hypothetical protein [candidate division KSB1 bacterium]NIR72480.1 hypothetical protein [candidate division KSB1 bacterium]NIS24065.1 hypothetical protein [candidate division KSB1 bacterium]NIT70984.1 hypothetical protein [candidate division KSB1 bacterium]NIU27395.1 hypothetical protein [candidate division KSB1 bacterium]
MNLNWQTEKRRLADILYRRATQGKEKVPYKEIVNKSFPEVFETCVRNYARRMFSSENPIRLEDRGRYDMENREVKEYVYGLKKAIIHQTIFENEEIRQLCNFAVDLEFNILTRPRRAILDLLFASSDQRSKEDILTVLQGFGGDRPFIHKLLKTIENLGFESIGRDKYEIMSRPLEKQIYSETPISAFLIDSNLFMDFENAITGQQDRKIRSNIVLGMLKERELDQMVRSFAKETSDKDSWTAEEIENTMDRFLLVGLDSITSDENEKTADSDDSISLDEEMRLEEEEPADNEKPLKIQFAEEKAKRETEAPSPSRTHYIPISRLKDKSFFLEYDEELIINRSDIESQPPGPYPALYDLIDARDRKVFIKKLFGKNKEQYLEFIDRLEQMDSWKDAKAAIDEELRVRDISPYSKEAVLLGDVVFSRYFKK